MSYALRDYKVFTVVFDYTRTAYSPDGSITEERTINVLAKNEEYVRAWLYEEKAINFPAAAIKSITSSKLHAAILTVHD